MKWIKYTEDNKPTESGDYIVLLQKYNSILRYEVDEIWRVGGQYKWARWDNDDSYKIIYYCKLPDPKTVKEE